MCLMKIKNTSLPDTHYHMLPSNYHIMVSVRSYMVSYGLIWSPMVVTVTTIMVVTKQNFPASSVENMVVTNWSKM